MMLYLGHGASGSAASMQPWVTALAARGVSATALGLPKSNAGNAVGVFRTAVGGDLGAAVGGHSYGGRMASLLAAEQPVKALILLSYPLHRPGHPEAMRTAHWAKITCPVLMLSGERDPFARIDLLHEAIRVFSDVELVTYPGIGHGLLTVIDDASARIAAMLL